MIIPAEKTTSRVIRIANPERVDPRQWCRVYIEAVELRGEQHRYVLMPRARAQDMGITADMAVEVTHRHGRPQITRVLVDKRRRTDAAARQTGHSQ